MLHGGLVASLPWLTALLCSPLGGLWSRTILPVACCRSGRQLRKYGFYDRRRDPQNRKQIVVLARSTDGGHTFNNYAWTDEPFEAGGVFFGDYSGLAAFGGRVYGVWT